jgi:hypothetical protein
MLRCLALAAPLALAALPVAAQEMRVTGGITAGTLGVGPELGLRLSDTIGLRANATFLRGDFAEVDADSDDIRFEGPLRLRSGGAMADFYPFSSGFRLSAGVRLNGNRATIRALPTTNVTIGARTVTPAQIGKLSADYRVRDWAPALTLGYAGELRPRLVVGFEAGLLFHGAPRIRNLRSEGGTLSGDPGLAADLDRERMLIENDIDDYRLYPVVQASLGYRF